ncbi:hypothetical protein [Leptolyngbya sp. GB1-A1]
MTLLDKTPRISEAHQNIEMKQDEQRKFYNKNFTIKTGTEIKTGS